MSDLQICSMLMSSNHAVSRNFYLFRQNYSSSINLSWYGSYVLVKSVVCEREQVWDRYLGGGGFKILRLQVPDTHKKNKGLLTNKKWKL